MSPNSPDVSVIIATRDRPHLLREALRSIATQDLTAHVEVVIVFDQTDPDTTLLKEFTTAGLTITLIPNTRTPGLAGARNSGILASSADLVAFCDDDDTWLPDKLRRQLVKLQAPGVNVVVCGIRVHYHEHTSERIPSANDVTLAELARRRVMEAHPSTVLVRRHALLEEIGLVDEEIPGSYAEDYDWILRAATAGPIAVVPHPLVNVLWGEQSFFAQRWHTIIDALDYCLAKHTVLRDDPRGHARIQGQKAFAYAALGQTAPALRCALTGFKLNWRERRSYVATLVGLRVISAQRVLRMAHAMGRGI